MRKPRSNLSTMAGLGVVLLVGIIGGLVGPASAQRTPTISYITQEQIKDIGGTVELECSVLYASDYSVHWVKTSNDRSDTVFLSTGSSLVLKDSRFSLRYDLSSTSYTLQIKDIQETDAGIYQCQVVLSVTNKISAEVALNVRRPPIISDNSTQSLVVSEGQPAQMECYASGYPVPQITWRRENNAILPTGGATYSGNVLNIHSVHKEDRGTYYCVADNGVSRGDRRNVNLEVEFAPVVTVPRPRVEQALQYDMDLECHIEAYPPPAIRWLKDSVQLSSNQHYQLSQFATADEFTDSTLRVITAEKRQYGEYICQATNKLGDAEGRVEFTESVIPVCPPACGQARYGGGASAISVSSVLMAVATVLTMVAIAQYVKRA
ncbi:lachesin [Anopheles merus]|uniref:Ig-like domain-containing protein n=2 Tax=gambiae species complex TaxID=44542 RepID=A0A6E8VU01_ANOCL|nr:lachesin [Anopheles merus]